MAAISTPFPNSADRIEIGIVKLQTLSEHARDPVIAVSTRHLESYLKVVGGAKGISVPDVLEPQQISTPLYIGATTPQAKTEVPHWHRIRGNLFSGAW
jgi:hypothetical protein